MLLAMGGDCPSGGMQGVERMGAEIAPVMAGAVVQADKTIEEEGGRAAFGNVGQDKGAAGFQHAVDVGEECALVIQMMHPSEAHRHIQRGIAHFPKAGDRGPWTVKMAYEDDVARLVDGPVEDDALAFSTPAPQAVTA